MSLQALIETIQKDYGSWLVIAVILSTLVEISPIKISPWTWITTKIGNAVNKNLLERIDKIGEKLDDHIAESVERDISARRSRILQFRNSLMDKNIKHTREEFEFVITECDKYEKYCKDNDIINGVIEETIKSIHVAYSEHLRTIALSKVGGLDEHKV